MLKEAVETDEEPDTLEQPSTTGARARSPCFTPASFSAVAAPAAPAARPDVRSRPALPTGRVTVLCTAASYDVPLLRAALEGAGCATKLYPEVLYCRYDRQAGPVGGGAGDIFFFEYGAVVFWDLTAAQEQGITKVRSPSERMLREGGGRDGASAGRSGSGAWSDGGSGAAAERMAWRHGRPAARSSAVPHLPGSALLSSMPPRRGCCGTSRWGRCRWRRATA